MGDKTNLKAVQEQKNFALTGKEELKKCPIQSISGEMGLQMNYVVNAQQNGRCFTNFAQSGRWRRVLGFG